jgi:hypothetical protein
VQHPVGAQRPVCERYFEVRLQVMYAN